MVMVSTWAVSFGENERMELERIVVDEDREAALRFLLEVVYPSIKESEKSGSCFHDVDKPVDGLERPVKRHKNLGSGRRR
jgi:hypothetical protein